MGAVVLRRGAGVESGFAVCGIRRGDLCAGVGLSSYRWSVVPVVHMLAPRPAPVMGFQMPLPVAVPHIAVGIWVAVAVVLLCPTPRHQKRKVPSEDDLMRGYGVAMSAFSLL